MTLSLAAVAPLIVLAVLAEAATEQIKDVLPKEPSDQGNCLIALGVSLGLAVLLRISLFEATGTINAAGILLAGMLCSRGSNYIHDLYGKLGKDSPAGKTTGT